MEYNMDFFQRILPEEFRGENFSQDAGRNWRQNESLSILESLSSNKERSQYIATAHHMEDQMETILMRILRGVHISNIQGVSFAMTPTLLKFQPIFDTFYCYYFSNRSFLRAVNF